MIVYVLMRQTGDGCTWENDDIEEIYLHKNKAEWERMCLEESEQDPNTSYFIREHVVIESML